MIMDVSERVEEATRKFQEGVEKIKKVNEEYQKIVKELLEERECIQLIEGLDGFLFQFDESELMGLVDNNIYPLDKVQRVVKCKRKGFDKWMDLGGNVKCEELKEKYPRVFLMDDIDDMVDGGVDFEVAQKIFDCKNSAPEN